MTTRTRPDAAPTATLPTPNRAPADWPTTGLLPGTTIRFGYDRHGGRWSLSRYPTGPGSVVLDRHPFTGRHAADELLDAEPLTLRRKRRDATSEPDDEASER